MIRLSWQSESARNPRSTSCHNEENQRSTKCFVSMAMMTISKPENLELPENESRTVMTLAEKGQERDIKAMDSILRSIKQIDGGPTYSSVVNHKDAQNPLLAEAMAYFNQSSSTLPNTDLVFSLQLLL